MNFTFSVILNWDSSLRFSRSIWKQIKELLVVNLKIADRNTDLLLWVRPNLWETLMDSPRNDSSVLEVWSSSIHGESLTSSSLAIAHNRPIVSINDWFDNLLSAVRVNVFLWSVMHYLVEFKLPRFLLIIYESSRCIFWDVDCHVLSK